MALQMDVQGLVSASGSYGTQSTLFSNAGSSLTTAMKGLTGEWKDAAGAQFAEVASSLESEVESLASKLSANAKVLSETANSASDMQTKIQSGIEGL